MGLRSNDRPNESSDEHHREQPATLDAETVRRIEHALEGTVEVDVSKLSADDKLTLLIERYNRKLRDDRRQAE
ncbi:hypothetical protein ACFQE8_24000 [Salinirubellus sp. GCM10025818]|uniref:hypothetical protein n=1 Tax=Salinirubellus TaxID=2162630 RepID=UPI0030CA5C72